MLQIWVLGGLLKTNTMKTEWRGEVEGRLLYCWIARKTPRLMSSPLRSVTASRRGHTLALRILASHGADDLKSLLVLVGVVRLETEREAEVSPVTVALDNGALLGRERRLCLSAHGSSTRPQLSRRTLREGIAGCEVAMASSRAMMREAKPGTDGNRTMTTECKTRPDMAQTWRSAPRVSHVT